MTGAYVRIYREGKWQTIEFDQLTDDEMNRIAEFSPYGGWQWAIFFAKWIRENIKGD